jgi:hypothetical protein
MSRLHQYQRPDCERIMEDAVTKLGFSARAYDRILKRIRTSGCAGYSAAVSRPNKRDLIPSFERWAGKLIPAC